RLPEKSRQALEHHARMLELRPVDRHDLRDAVVDEHLPVAIEYPTPGSGLGHEADPVALRLHLVRRRRPHLEIPQAREHHRQPREGDDAEHPEPQAGRLRQRHHRANAPPLAPTTWLALPAATAQRVSRSATGANTALRTPAMAATAARWGRMSWLSPTTAPAMANSTSPVA